ncbi:unnamed protein product [Rotaria sp. Silwood1]|nr:unnamed protein product [Rotaria sp. Silwood1]CAF3450724.1 unnamed protein product [Rotaria sp. Silwood1]CAF4578526.1 unnamed protein product [Rotaria sp. Silwood1]
MSSTIFDQQNSSPVVARRPPISNEDIGNSSQRSVNRRSLSDRLRNLFRKDSSSPNRSASNDRRVPTSSVRQTSSSPEPNRSSTGTPGLRAPAVYWPFGKKKAKLSTTPSTPKTSKKKTKDNRKTKQSTVPPIEISSPIYVQDNRTSRYSQNFDSRTPEYVHDNNEGLQPSTNYDTLTRQGYRDYMLIDETRQSQQTIVPDVDVFIHPTYTNNRSPSPSMNRQRLPNINIEYRYQNDNSMPAVTIPYADVEVISTPQRKRKVGDAPSLNTTQMVVDKPPIFPQTSSRPPSNTNTNPVQWRNTSSSSSTLNTSETRAASASSRDRDVPKLNAPLINFGGTSNKKKPKRTKSQSRADRTSDSSSTIANLVKLNPVQPYRPWSSTYGSLPDAEIISDDNYTSYRPSKTSISTYPGLSAIVRYHIHPTPVYRFDEHPPTTTTTPQRPRRFDTSTTTLNDYEENEPWSRSPAKDTSTSTCNIQRHDGYIRPMTPQNPSVSLDIDIAHRDHEDLRDASLSPIQRAPCDSPEPPATYRSSTTVYTRGRTPCFCPGEIRTWSSQENGMNNNYNDSYQKPFTFVQVERTNEQKKNCYDHQTVPLEQKDTYEEHRYSPRYVEQDLYEKQHHIIDDNDQDMHEEQYEVSYVYENQHPQYTYEIQPTDQYSSDNFGINNMISSIPTFNMQSSMITERDNTYDQSSRSYIDSEYIQEPFLTRAPVDDFERNLHSCTLKRTDSYDGLGILISTDIQTRTHHYIREVEPTSPGHKAGLRKNDRIISINGINVENMDFTDVLGLIKQGLNNDNLQLSVIHEPEHI